jgi:ABC-type polysaccharide/polyol phosphate export permease
VTSSRKLRRWRRYAYLAIAVGAAIITPSQDPYTMLALMLPMWLLSGIFFSSERFPAAAQPFIQALPLTMLNDALRAIILEGAGLTSQGMRLAGLAAWGGVSFVLALRWFRWN